MKTIIFKIRIILIMSFVLMACSHGKNESSSILHEVEINNFVGEIREYSGQQLSSIGDFRENSIKGVQKIPKSTYSLKIYGLVQTPVEMTYDQVLENNQYSKVVTLNCVEGWTVKILWKGILVEDLIKRAGVKEGAATLIFHAVDGYKISIPLEDIYNNHLLLAFKMNGLDLPPERGFPFQLVAESKWGLNWVKWVTGIEVSDY
jgi:DMSO/TMAO reductase YedYZ molybdopterin-dependent catalytic subunit